MLECLGDVERRQEEPYRDETQRPVGCLPDRDTAQVARGWRHDPERLRHTLPEVRDVTGDPERDGADRDQRTRDREIEEEWPGEEPGEVEAPQAWEHVETRQLPEAHRPHEQRTRREHVEEAQDERARDDRRVRAAGNRAVRKDDANRIAGTCGMIALIPTPAR